MPTDLWSFALSCYAQPGVERTCLSLQDGGADVCLLLCALWLERRQLSCSAERLTQLRAVAEPWQHQVVRPLRELRQNWKADSARDSAQARLREQIKRLELEAEQELLRRLEGVTQKWQATDSAVAWLEQLVSDRDARELLRAAARQA
ncbi:TIGR02444 family protein [Pseudomonas sp. Gutcm_11s]|uniref:TIGR02444 family protein n=1 Tax=Pseudomonas sp. Gutcm_11s TaxID=3026088 RepID=UPI002360196A|nr:TIGR02444 family protein [Pseudomonas sp. Gutcm_11s]MDD0842304.1 TIGR02444 family protein [Pseudomonas sp. Gutcm_11s]